MEIPVYGLILFVVALTLICILILSRIQDRY